MHARLQLIIMLINVWVFVQSFVRQTTPRRVSQRMLRASSCTPLTARSNAICAPQLVVVSTKDIQQSAKNIQLEVVYSVGYTGDSQTVGFTLRTKVRWRYFTFSCFTLHLAGSHELIAQSSSTNMAARRFSCRVSTVCNSLPFICTHCWQFH